MASRVKVKKVNYCYLTAPSRAGQGAAILGKLKEAGVNLVAFHGFPAKGGKSQLDLVSEDMTAVRRVAKKNGWRLSKTKRGFLVQGLDEVGAVWRQIENLGNQKINVTAADAVAAGNGLFGMILWVKPKDYARAARILKAK